MPPATEVDADRERWRRTRRALNRSRGELALLAAGLHPRDVRVGDLPFLAPRHWMPDAPVPLGEIRLEWADDPPVAEITGGEAEAAAVLPLRAPGHRFARYTAAMGELDRPALFEDRASYRLLAADLATGPHLRFGPGTYFDKLDVTEAVAHELALARAASAGPPAWADLPLRALVGDPFDLHRRHVVPAIETLTLRRARTGEATFLLHWRDPAKVATTAGIHGLVPAGEFQPSTDAAHDRDNDFDLWRSVVREYSEEVLGEPERDAGSGAPLRYADWPLYRALQEARAAGRVRPYCLGLGLDPLTLSATVLTVAVFDADVFDDLFGAAVEINAEGRLVGAAGATKVTDGLPFTGECVSRLLAQEQMASPAACILARAHTFRDLLLPGP